ncbi:MAG: hypothetical protein HON77_08420 [Gammaproteobacteria bacterium]|jgi:hypothetical protein|nr:hypothetical protein [Gammaproteobacteria bacterium]MBT6584316.1 hypothetical protein [Gammaproteobacteria bacterium]MBT6890423.1 hypothetical protein [Gammaproteobacteria bacterium]
MKVFVPMSDAALGDNGEVSQRLIPFDLSLLGSPQKSGKDKKPSNWVPDYDRDQARQRLFAAQG